MQETWVWPLGQEDPLEKEMATTLVSLPGELNGQRRLVGYSPQGDKELDMTEYQHTHTDSFSTTGQAQSFSVFYSHFTLFLKKYLL